MGLCYDKGSNILCEWISRGCVSVCVCVFQSVQVYMRAHVCECDVALKLSYYPQQGW